MSRTIRSIGHPVPVLWLGLALALAGAAGGCGRAGSEEQQRSRQQLNRPEGQLLLVAPPGYVPSRAGRGGADWVTPFERETGCEVTADVADNPGQLVVAMRSGDYDGAAAPANVIARMIENEDADSINTRLVPSYARIFGDLKREPLARGRRVYGIPLARTPHLVAWNSRAVRPPPRSSVAIFQPQRRVRGPITAYDDPMYIADAALYLKPRRPELEITDPYRLDEDQFEAAVEVLEVQADRVVEYWTDPAEARAALARRHAVTGITPPLAGPVGERGVRVRSALPREGATGRLDAWTIHPNAEHPDCMYRWLEHVTSAEVNAQVAERLHAAPANRRACRFTADPGHCDLTHAADRRFWRRVHLWRLPRADCRDDRGEACKPYDEWVLAWSEIRN